MRHGMCANNTGFSFRCRNREPSVIDSVITRVTLPPSFHLTKLLSRRGSVATSG
jgi:hypothetical protein